MLSRLLRIGGALVLVLAVFLLTVGYGRKLRPMWRKVDDEYDGVTRTPWSSAACQGGVAGVSTRPWFGSCY